MTISAECLKVTPNPGKPYDTVRFVAALDGELNSGFTMYLRHGHGFEAGEVYQVSFKKREPLGGG